VKWSIHHVNLQAHDVRRSVAFFCDIIGLEEGRWQLPPGQKQAFNADPDHLAILGDNSRGIHIVKPVPEFARDNGLLINPTIGGHVAITVPDIEAVKRRLKAAGIMYSEGGRYAMAGVTNLYVYDPSANIIEINQVVEP
jgi:catechol 2,3-dioxygenase-like lactoylglutathione lyase family enzyme